MNIVITGASRGIGKAIAEKFGEDKQGHTILLCSKNEEPLKFFARELQGRFPRTNIDFFAADLGEKEGAESFAKWVLKKIIKIDVLVNNVGTFVPGNVTDEPDGALDEMIKVNLYSAYYITRALVSRIKENKGGYIFNISSIAGLQAYPNGGAYSISKFALAGFSKNLREELKQHNVKVTTVYPGAVYTDSWKESGVAKDRIMEAEDIAKIIYSITTLSHSAVVEDIIMRPQLGDL